MIPYVGDDIHVDSYPDDDSIKCRAAKIGDIIWEDGKIKTVYAAVFNVHNNLAPVTNVVLIGREHWHTKEECTVRPKP